MGLVSDMHTLRIGTRGSRLALWQANAVKQSLALAGMQAEIVEIQTKGDELLDISISKIGEKGVFTKALDDALIEGSIDIAVHSSKDIPTELPDALEIVAIMKREDPRDVMLALSEEVHLENFTRSFKIGTSSLRRQALLKHYFPQHQVLELRGNLDTRIDKLIRGDYDGIILAYAGVKRNDMLKYVVQKFNVNVFAPAVAQGAVGVMARKNDPIAALCRLTLNDSTSEIEVSAERSFLNYMNGGCHAPIFGLATCTANHLTLAGGVAAMDGSAIVKYELNGERENAISMGVELAKIVLANGGKELLYGI
jgi:hydroxymethylbilane synthase